MTAGVCRICGCTWATPCGGGCAWVPGTADTLCTACLDARWRIAAAGDGGAVTLVDRRSGYRRHYTSTGAAVHAAIRLMTEVRAR